MAHAAATQTATGLRAFLIDPEARTITELDYEGGDDPQVICRLIGAKSIDSASLACVDDVVAAAFVDDEGLLNPNACFRFDGYPHPLAGKALILGCNRHGYIVGCPLTLERLTTGIRWVDQALALAKVRADRPLITASAASRSKPSRPA